MTSIPTEAWPILEARSHDPFSFLGCHPRKKGGHIIRVFRPRVAGISIVLNNGKVIAMQRIETTDLFTLRLGKKNNITDYRLRLFHADGHHWEQDDTYRFSPFLGDMDLHLIGEGNHFEQYNVLGAHLRQHEGASGVAFAVWAPSASRVSVVGNFNHWDGRESPMRVRGSSGIWELFIPGLCSGETYKYEIRTQSGELLEKTDPYAQQMEVRPNTASVVHDAHAYAWNDADWVSNRAKHQALDQPMSIYEVHLGSWQKNGESFLNYRDLAHQLVEYSDWMGYTHIELLPITEHPFDGSWGYQTVGYFAPTSRFGTPDDFCYFVDYCHQHGLGVFLDWVPAHFPKDSHGLARFDGTALYEHEDPRLGEHKDWGTYIFNFGRNEVRNFLIASALFWLDRYHIDGLRVDAVASMLYLDYSREADEWVPNQYGGRENLEAVAFLKQFNHLVHERFAGAVTMAEESTSWPMVSRPTWLGGLGFTMKWNMGWMNDSLDYFAHDPVHRSHHHNQMTFSLIYAHTENFILPFSHDEVVHGKGSMAQKMPGDDWQKFANLRLLYAYMFTHPGKKLQFMGIEFGQWLEWDEATSLQWEQCQHMPHQGLQVLVRDLNHLHRNIPALHELDFESEGFEWLDCNDHAQSVLSFARVDKNGGVIYVILNMTPVVREDYRLGVFSEGNYRERMNTDAVCYGGSNTGNDGSVYSEPIAAMGHKASLLLRLPPLACLVLQQEYANA